MTRKTIPVMTREIIPDAVDKNIDRLVVAIDTLTKEMDKAVSLVCRTQEELLRSKTKQVDGMLAKLGSQLDRITYSRGFYEGRRHIVSTAEDIMAKHFGFSSREKLVASDKLPAFWIATLAMCFEDPPLVILQEADNEKVL